jgi:hypothetical protein
MNMQSWFPYHSARNATLIPYSIWKDFIPFPYLGVFQRGGYYAKEIVPDQLAVISLNTMYFYDSNKGSLLSPLQYIAISSLTALCSTSCERMPVQGALRSWKPPVGLA